MQEQTRSVATRSIAQSPATAALCYATVQECAQSVAGYNKTHLEGKVVVHGRLEVLDRHFEWNERSLDVYVVCVLVAQSWRL